MTSPPEEATAFRRHMLVRDGPDVRRGRPGHDPAPGRAPQPPPRRPSPAFGADTGHDIPVTVEFTRALQPLLERFGTADGFHLVLFTLDETIFSREIAPLAGFYPRVYAGAPWWFLDAPEAIRRYRGAVTETAGFYRTSGFIDDTRAFLSIPARHDMSRRLDAGLPRRSSSPSTASTRTRRSRPPSTSSTTIPRKVFKL